MPWYDGETLESRLQREPLSRAEALEIFQPLARALAAMHAAGVRHQDVKPENIFLARIPGFGEARGHSGPTRPRRGSDRGRDGGRREHRRTLRPRLRRSSRRSKRSRRSATRRTSLRSRSRFETRSSRRRRKDVAAGAVDTFIELSLEGDSPCAEPTHRFSYLRPSFDRWMNRDPDVRPSADELAEELCALSLPEERRIADQDDPAVDDPDGARAARRVWRRRHRVLPAGGNATREVAAQATQTATGSRHRTLATTREIAEQLELRYEQSRLTRTELAKRLARTDGKVASLKTHLQGRRAPAPTNARQARAEPSGEGDHRAASLRD